MRVSSSYVNKISKISLVQLPKETIRCGFLEAQLFSPKSELRHLAFSLNEKKHS